MDSQKTSETSRSSGKSDYSWVTSNSPGAATSYTHQLPPPDQGEGPAPPNVWARPPKSGLNREHPEVKACLQNLLWTQQAWKDEWEHLEAVLGPEHYEELVSELSELVPKDLDSVDAAKEVVMVLANPKIQQYLHGSTRCLGYWDLGSRKFLDLVHSSQQSPDVFRPGKSSVIYYGSSFGNSLRLGTSLVSLAGNTSGLGKGLSLFANGLVALLGLIHCGIMKRDHFKAKDSNYRERAKAYSNTEGAYAYIVSEGLARHEDTKAFLDCCDAWKKIPNTSRVAKLEHDKATFANERETLYPINVVASTVAQILGIVTTGYPAGYVISGLMTLSALLFIWQAYYDLRQGGVEYVKASELREFARNWPEKMNSAEIQALLQGDEEFKAVYTALMQYMSRMEGEQGFEVYGGAARIGKGIANSGSSAGSFGFATVQALVDTKPAPPTVMGIWVSFVAMCYMGFTATKMAKRNSAGVTSKHLQRHAQITEALCSRDDITQAMLNPGRPLTLDRPVGTYDERSGFLITKMDVEPGDNEYHSMARLAEHVAEYTHPYNPALDKEMLVDLIARHSHTPPLEWRAVLDYAQGIQDDHRRLDFIKRRLAPGYKTEFRLEPGTEREARLRPEILVHAAIKEVNALREDLRDFRVDAELEADKFAPKGEKLYEALEEKGFFNRFEETEFSHAMDIVWAERIQCTDDTDARNALHQVQLVAQHIIRIRSERMEHVLLHLSRKDGDGDLIRKTLRHDYPGLDEKSVKHLHESFLAALTHYLTAESNHDRKAMLSAATTLSRNPLVQRLIRDAFAPGPASPKTLLGKLACSASLKPILRMLDWDPTLLKNEFEKVAVPVPVPVNMDGADVEGSGTEDGGEEVDRAVDVKSLLRHGATIADDADNSGVENDTPSQPTVREAGAPSNKVRRAEVTGFVRRSATRAHELAYQIKALIKPDGDKQARAYPYGASSSSSSKSEEAPLVAVKVEGDATYSSRETHSEDSIVSTASYAQSSGAQSQTSHS
ncbi:MAG: hypothetical protein JWP36_822 [Paucimonas sp.]|nr:hypothetical protein [Paucimonas sp.]